MLALLTSRAGLVVLSGAFVAMALTVSHTQAYLAGKRSERTATLQRAVEAYKSREEIDNEVGRADLVDICIALGGVRDDCAAELRRMEAAAEGK